MPVEDEQYSSFHWAKVAERFAGTLTNGMYFAGSWDMGEGLPPEPTEGQVPWYRVTGNDATRAERRRFKEDKDEYKIALWHKIIRNSNSGDQLIWDPVKKEWFLIDTSDEVWLVNGKKGNVVLDADDVGALSLSGGNLSDDIKFKDKSKGVRLAGGMYFRSGAQTDGLMIIGDGDCSKIRFVTDTVSISDNPNNDQYRIYHQGFKPTSEDIGLGGLPNAKTDNPEPMTQTSWPRPKPRLL